MSLNAVYLVLALVAATTVAGVLWRRRQGTARPPQKAGGRTAGGDVSRNALVVHPEDVGFGERPAAFGSTATLLQFSTEFCASCPATRRMLGAVAEARDGVTHVDVDLTHRADLANRFGILQTPTTFVLDATGTLIARIGGSPRRAVIHEQLDSIVSVH